MQNWVIFHNASIDIIRLVRYYRGSLREMRDLSIFNEAPEEKAPRLLGTVILMVGRNCRCLFEFKEPPMEVLFFCDIGGVR